MFKSVVNKLLPYGDNEEILVDLMHLLDLNLLRIFAKDEEKTQGDNPWKGLVISPDEIHKLLFNEQHKEKSPESEKLDRMIDRKWEMVKKRQSITSVEFPCINLMKRFNLDDMSLFILILGISNSIDSKYERIFGYLNDNVTKKHPTFDILTRVLELSAGENLNLKKRLQDPWATDRLLIKWDESDGSPFYSKEILLDERIIQYLINDIDEIKEHSYYKLSFRKKNNLGMLIHEDLFENILQSVKHCKDGVFMLTGDVGVGKKYLLENVAGQLGRPTLIMDSYVFINSDISFSELLRRIKIEIKLTSCFVVIDHIEHFFDDSKDSMAYLRNWMKEFSISKDPLFIIAHSDVNITKVSDVPVLKYQFKRPTYEERHRLWSRFSENMGLKKLNLEDLSEKFKFTPLQIKNALTQYELTIRNQIDSSIYEVAKEQIHHKLGENATLVKPVFSWDQLVLPQEQSFILKSVCTHVEKRHLVFSKWGFEKIMPYGSGTAVVFAGPPGTGKTMAAQVLSKELNLDLYKIDISQMVSKYIGETEKNLHRIFEEASISNAILFFDEADALFGKRSDVKDAKDRYANIEVAYLLQKIEEYDGITILATNFLNNIDKAFMRRIRFVVDFPFPDAESREKIWRLSIPKAMPLGSDIDFEYLGRTFELSGGNIKNIVVNSAFFAAEEEKPMSMRDIIKAAGYELQKMDKLLLRKDLKEFGYLMD